MSSDDVSIVVNKRVLSGWSDVRITRSVERAVSDFEVTMTERFPNVADVEIQPGDPCQVFIGADLVITGYVDRYTPEFDAHQHTIRVSGRSKTQDIVDCSAIWQGSQIMNGTVLSIAQDLCKPFDVEAIALTDVGPALPTQVNINVGDTPFDILEPLSRYRGLLIYDNTEGNLVFSTVGTIVAYSGFTEGVNVESASVSYTMDNRFKFYSAYRLKFATNFQEIGGEGNLIAKVEDSDVPRRRTKFIVAESYDGGYDVAEKRANWEMARRKGRSAVVHLVTDSWRDAIGALWTPNTLASISLPRLKLDDATWLIGEVTYLKSSRGTHAQVTLMHPKSFLPQPYVFPFRTDLGAALKQASDQ